MGRKKAEGQVCAWQKGQRIALGIEIVPYIYSAERSSAVNFLKSETPYLSR